MPRPPTRAARRTLPRRPLLRYSTRMTEPLRIGLAGYGFGVVVFHSPLLASVETCDFLGVVTTSPERRALVTADHPDVATFDSLEALAAAGAEAVAISTPADTHSPLSDEALALGLHVVCDKPFALDAAAAARSVELAAERGLVLVAVPEPAVGLRLPHTPAPRRERAARARRAVGEPLRTVLAARWSEAGRRRGAARLREPPHRPGAGRPRSGRLGLRRMEHRRQRPRRRRVRRAHPREPCPVAPLGELAAAGAGTAVPCGRHRGGLCRRRPDGRTGGGARRRRNAAVARRSVGHGAARALGPHRAGRQRRRRGRAVDAGRVAHVLPRVRGHGAR